MAAEAPQRLADIWVYLAATPLLGLTLTLLVYHAAFVLYRRSGFHPLANPVPPAVLVLATLLWATGTPYATYFEGAQFVHFLLGPATVALAVPLFEQMHRLRQLALPLLGALVAGVLATTVTAIALAWALGASPATLASLAPKSVTMPVAMGIAEKIGGLPSLTAVRGFALGTIAHGIGTARAFQESEESGAFAGLAMGLSALFSALVLPAVAAGLLAWMAP